MDKKTTAYSKIAFHVQEETLAIKPKKGSLFIGIPKETCFEEKRICLTPDGVAALSREGHQILIESGAGLAANFTDKEYAENGAQITYNNEEAFGCNIILKVAPPSETEIGFIKNNTVLISSLQLKTQNKNYFKLLSKKKVTALAFDFVKDSNNNSPILKSLSEIAGYASILIASELMDAEKGGSGKLIGNITGVPPTEIVILGAGTVGVAAAKSAIGLGASVKVFDNSISKLQELQTAINTPIYTSTIHHKALMKALMRCDVLIAGIRGKMRAPVIVSEDMIKLMKEGAVVVDVSIDRGGCVETSEITTHSHPTVSKYGVVHYGVPNIPSRYAKTASISISNIITPYFTGIGEDGGIENAIKYNNHLRNGIYLYKGVVTHKSVADWFDLNYTDINLLIL